MNPLLDDRRFRRALLNNITDDGTLSFWRQYDYGWTMIDHDLEIQGFITIPSLAINIP
jgi:hypothetical protein